MGRGWRQEEPGKDVHGESSDTERVQSDRSVVKDPESRDSKRVDDSLRHQEGGEDAKLACGSAFVAVESSEGRNERRAAKVDALHATVSLTGDNSSSRRTAETATWPMRLK